MATYEASHAVVHFTGQALPVVLFGALSPPGGLEIGRTGTAQ